MVYVTVPTLVSVTAIDPEVASVPVQPSPELPPEATQEFAFDELQVSEMAEPADCVALLLASRSRLVLPHSAMMVELRCKQRWLVQARYCS